VRAKAMTFAQCANGYIQAREKSWSAKHVRQVTHVITTYIAPEFGALSAQAVDTSLVLQVLARLGFKGKVTTHGFRSCFSDCISRPHRRHRRRQSFLANLAATDRSAAPPSRSEAR